MTTKLPIIMSCDGCGVCCMHMGAPPYDSEEVATLRETFPIVAVDYDAVLATRLLQLDATGVDYVPCGFFDIVTRRCRHYEHRPEICQDFERGGEDCLSQRWRAGL